MKIKSILAVLLLLLSTIVSAQNFEKTEFGVKAVINSVKTEIQFYSPSTVRVIKYPKGKEFIKESLSVIKDPEKISFSTKKVDDELILSSSKLQVKLNLINGKISYFDKDVSILSEIANGTSFEDFNDAGVETYTVAQSFLLDKEEAIYGLGQ